MFPWMLLAARDESTPFVIGPESLAPLGLGLAIVALLAYFGQVPVRYNLRNLSVRWRSTLLTGIAFTIVIALLTVMLAFVNGMYKLTQSSGQPGNVIVLSEGSTDESFSNLGMADIGDIELQPGVVRDDAGQSLSSRETYVIVNQPVQVRQPGRPKGRFTQVRGVRDAELSARVHGLTLFPGGEWFSQAGVRSIGAGAEAIEAVLGEGIARELARDRPLAERTSGKNPERLEPGETFPLGGRKWIVVGVMPAAGSTFASEVWAKQDIVGNMFGKPSATSLVLRTAGPAEARKLKEYLNGDYEKSSVQAYVETEYFESLSEVNRQFLVAIIIVTAIMAIGGVFGVMNTMFAAVAQRGKDIGVLRILGFSRPAVLASFLLESLALSLAGGALGCALGTLAHGTKAASVVGSGPGGGKFVVLELLVSGDIIAAGLVVSLAMGLAGGLLPAILAMLVRPLESLR